jgi:hypothetical protein
LVVISHKKGGGHMRKILIDNNQNINPRECTYGFSWRHDATCFNFRTPDEFIPYHDLSKIIDMSDVETLVIGCELDDYDFISDMTNLRQLYIYSGGKISNIDFIKNLVYLKQVYIAESHIDSLNGLVKVIEEKRRRIDTETDMWKRIELGMEGICIESDCNSLDGKELLEIYISEVIINGKRIRKGN